MRLPTVDRSVIGYDRLMHLYTGTTQEFVSDSVQNLIADKIAASFFQSFRYNAPKSEVGAWRSSLRAMANAVELAALDDHGVVVEWQLPLSSRRLDVMIVGRDANDQPNAVIVELKQWERSEPAIAEDCVRTFLGGAEREVLHPSAQVRGYHRYLKDTHSAFTEDGFGLQACSFLHNMVAEDDDEVFSSRHANLLQAYPVFTGDRITDLAEYLQERLSGGGGVVLMDRILTGRYHPSKKLLEHTAEMIKGEPIYELLDEQKVVFNTVIAKVAERHGQSGHSVFIVDGGPGTGKSVIALNLIAELAVSGYSTQHATGSKAFTENVRKKVGNRAASLFKYFNTYLTAEVEELDVLICDEAHRIRAASHTRFTKKADRTDRPQIEELISVAKVSVFFIDDLQVVRPGEVGSKELIREHAERLGAEVFEYQLDIQFRCGGSDGFINWIDNTLGLRRTTNILWEGDEAYDFDIVDSPRELEALINQKDAGDETARLVAGLCWPWSDPVDGVLVNDVRLDDWVKPWNAKENARGLAAGIPKSVYWASDPGGLGQVGCVYTAQGFEFDYVGVIFGRDLVHRGRDGWVGQREISKDSVVKQERDEERFTELVKQTYRVLMTRGMKGCYVYFEDPATRRFFESRIDFDAIRARRLAAASVSSGETAEVSVEVTT